MARLVFDIESSALSLDRFDEAQQEYLFRECAKIAEEPARDARRAEILQQCSLWPFTAQVICIAMLNADTSRGQVLFTADELEEEPGEAGPVKFVSCVDEAELFVPSFGPMATLVAGEPDAVARDHEVVAQRVDGHKAATGGRGNGVALVKWPRF